MRNLPIFCLLLSSGLCGQTPAEEIQALKDRVAALEKIVAQLQGASPQAAAAAPAAIPATATPAPAPAYAGPALPPAPSVPPGARREVVGDDPRTAARIDNKPIDPQMSGFFTFPGTETMLRFGGYAKVDFINDFSPAGNTDTFVPSSIPTSSLPFASNFQIHARQTRLNLEMRRTIDGSTLKFFTEADLFGTNATSFRMRHAYGQWKNLLAGWTWSNFVDIDAIPDTLDFAGPNSMSLVRQAQVRYTHKLGGGHSFAISAERPLVETDLQQTYDVKPTALIPDLAAKWRYDGERGHWQFGSVIRSVGGYIDQVGEKHILGYGFSLGGGYDLGERDHLSLQMNGGQGIGRYLNDLSGQNADLSANVGANSDRSLSALPVAGGFAALQHRWNRQWRSNAVFSFLRVSNSNVQPATALARSGYSAVNLLWSPDKSLLFGAEYLYGWNAQKGGPRGNASRLQFSVMYYLVK